MALKHILEEQAYLDDIKSKLHPSFQQDLLYEDHEMLKPTKKGVLFLNEILHNLI